jgi:hypothetical protein
VLKGTHHRVLIAVCLTLVVACASAPNEYEEGKPLQSAHCESVAAQSATSPGTNVDTPAQPVLQPIPPPAPPSARGRTVRVQIVVDAAGRSRRVTIDGITDREYLSELERHMKLTRFVPATRGECRVYDLALLTFQL